LTQTYFLKLTLEANDGALLSSNFYWLSTKEDELDWTKSTWYYTPTQSYADYTQLQNLAPVTLNASGSIVRRGDNEVAHITLENPSRNLAFFVRLQILNRSGGEEILPVVWQDNYFSMLPGEKREVTATYRIEDSQDARPSLVVGGWNITTKPYTLDAFATR